MTPPRVLIIGGGIGGLTAAIALHRAGIPAAVYERTPKLRDVGAGIILWTNAMKVFRKLGVGLAVEAKSTVLRLAELRDWRGKLLSTGDLTGLGARFGAPTAGIHRADLQAVLADHLGREHITLGTACVGYSQDANGVTARFADGREVRGEILVGADGLNSAVRSQLLGPQRPRYSGSTAWRGVGIIDRPEVPVGVSLLTMGRGSEFGYLPIGGGRTYWFATAVVPAGGSDGPAGAKPVLLDRFRDWYAPVRAVIDATPPDAILRNDLADRPPVTNWTDGRVTLLGDAAHPTTPHLGQGACMAIESAWVLAECLTAGGVEGLQTYQAKRLARTAEVTNRSRMLGKMLAYRNPLACWLRDRLFALMRKEADKLTDRLAGAEV
ncbi:MAG: FAD-dependent monooxygenase [Fimbriiglobus sp.]|jgi:2-polyprenyl-6-methoxyphenol hydroxylase-like FAD-dependent oxidoreductase|nr:FAD-dependent monooxygenase [Fimbriiglobus sp.]